MREENNAVLKKECHSKLDLESHLMLLRNNEILNQVQDDEGRTATGNVGQVVPDNKGCSPRPMEGEGGRRPGEGLSFSPSLAEKGSRSGVSLTNKRDSYFDDVRLTPDLHPKWRSVFTTRSIIPVLRTAENAGYSGRSGFTTRHSSSRSVGMRGIGAARAFTLNRHPELDSGSRRLIDQNGEIPNQVWNDKCFGFTLIELLVVVLIIGILAAIAVPQYQKTVLKSRFSTLLPLAKALREGNENYYLMYGKYASNLSDLDITSNDSKVKSTLGNEVTHKYVRATRDDIKNRITMYQNHSANFPNEIHCEALVNHSQANWLCKDAFKGTYIGDKYGYSVYALDVTDPNSTLGRIYYNKSAGKSYTEQDVCWATANYGCDGAVTITNGAACVANADVGCRNVKASNHAVCINGKGTGAGCYWATFDNYSICKVNSGNFQSCMQSIFTNGSVCFADVAKSCQGTGKYSSQTGTYQGYSSCVGNKANTCQNSIFSDHSVCYANASGACTGATYLDDTSCCAGAFCTEHTCASKGIEVTQPVYEEMLQNKTLLSVR